jgi:hypothetical protein
VTLAIIKTGLKELFYHRLFFYLILPFKKSSLRLFFLSCQPLHFFICFFLKNKLNLFSLNPNLIPNFKFFASQNRYLYLFIHFTTILITLIPSPIFFTPILYSFNQNKLSQHLTFLFIHLIFIVPITGFLTYLSNCLFPRLSFPINHIFLHTISNSKIYHPLSNLLLKNYILFPDNGHMTFFVESLFLLTYLRTFRTTFLFFLDHFSLTSLLSLSKLAYPYFLYNFLSAIIKPFSLF